VFEGEVGVSRLIDLDDQRHSSFRAAKRERLPGVLVRDRVNVLEIGVRTTLDDAASKLGFLVRIVEIDYGESDPRIAESILRFQRASSRADQDAIPFPAHPYGHALRRSVRQQRGEVREVRAIDTKAFISLESGVAIKDQPCPGIRTNLALPQTACSSAIDCRLCTSPTRQGRLLFPVLFATIRTPGAVP